MDTIPEPVMCLSPSPTRGSGSTRTAARLATVVRLSPVTAPTRASRRLDSSRSLALGKLCPERFFALLAVTFGITQQCVAKWQDEWDSLHNMQTHNVQHEPEKPDARVKLTADGKAKAIERVKAGECMSPPGQLRSPLREPFELPPTPRPEALRPVTGFHPTRATDR